MRNLNVQLIIHPEGKLTVFDDYTEIEDLCDYVSVEFLSYKCPNNVDERTVCITDYSHYRDNLIDNTVLPIFKDGILYYHKVLVPKLSFLCVESGIEHNGIPLYNEIYLKDQIFCLNNKFYKYKGEINIQTDVPMSYDNILQHYKDEILNQSDIITNYSLLYDEATNADQSFSCQKMLFTICKLTKCFVNLQRKILDLSIVDQCMKNASDVKDRDFLLCSIYVLDYLKDIGQFDEAQRILENITECGGFCSENNQIDCGCNG